MRKQIQLQVDGAVELVEVEELGNGHMRLLDTPLFSDGELRFGTILGAELLSSNEYRVTRIVAQPAFKTQTFVLGPTSEAQKAALSSLCASNGVVLEEPLEGFVVLNIPPEARRDFLEVFSRVWKAT